MRVTVAEVNLDNLRYNVSFLKKIGGNTSIMAVVKANSYGHGAVEVSKVLQSEGVHHFAVAYADEAVALRNNGINGNIVILVQPTENDYELICRYDLQPVCGSLTFLEGLQKYAENKDFIVKAHLFIDTGMSRDGVNPDDALNFMQKAANFKNIRFVGISTHFTSAADDLKSTKQQTDLFKHTVDKLENSGFKFEYVHASNTAGLVNYPEAHFNLVRPGLGLYGYPPDRAIADKYDLKPLMSWKTKVILKRRLKPGDTVSYNREYVVREPATIVTLPVGYGDGLVRSLKGKIECIIRGKRYPIVGVICMDECMVNVGNDDIEIGDDVVLLGKQGNEEINAMDLADAAGTIPYEITTLITSRVPRVYIGQ